MTRNLNQNTHNGNYNLFKIIKLVKLGSSKIKLLRPHIISLIIIFLLGVFIWMYSTYSAAVSMNSFHEEVDITTTLLPTLKLQYIDKYDNVSETSNKTKQIDDSHKCTEVKLNNYFKKNIHKMHRHYKNSSSSSSSNDKSEKSDKLLKKESNKTDSEHKFGEVNPLNNISSILKYNEKSFNFSDDEKINYMANYDLVDESLYYETNEEQNIENDDKKSNNNGKTDIKIDLRNENLTTVLKSVVSMNKTKDKLISQKNYEVKEVKESIKGVMKESKNYADLEKLFESNKKHRRYKFKNSYDEKYRPWMRQIVKQKYIKQSRRNIFFVESSCGTIKLRKKHNPEEGLVLNARQSCAIESTARINPNYKVYLFHTCEIDEAFYELSSNYVRELFFYENFFLVKVNMDQLFNSTPLEDLWCNKIFEGSHYPLEHISDAMRLLILWKYGGTYLDLDVVTMRPLTPLKSNFAGVQDDDTIANGVLNFEPTGFAHSLLTSCLENFHDWFDGKEWSGNGPILLTNALLDFCQVSEVIQVLKSRCGGFHLYPPSIFYPVHFSDWESFLEEGEGDRIMKQIENSTIVHMWNHLSRDGYVAHGSNQAFSLLADKYCPRVYQEVGPNFRR